MIENAPDKDEGAVTKFKQECDRDNKFMKECILALPWTAPYATHDQLGKAWTNSKVYDRLTGIIGVEENEADQIRVVGKCAKALENYMERRTFHR